MRIGLIDVDGHNGHPNLALMRLSAWHKAHGDSVEWWNGFEHYDRVYMSKVFTFTPDMETVIDADEIIQGGTGYKDYGSLPPDIEAHEIVTTLEKWGITPFAQPYRDYDGGEPPEIQKHFARWVNCKQLFKSCTWDEYDRRR